MDYSDGRNPPPPGPRRRPPRNQISYQWTWVIYPGTLDERELLLRTETDPYYIPDEPMALYFNFWAPTADWGKAYDERLQPVNYPMLNEIAAYEIDYVEIRVPEPQTLFALMFVAACLLGRRRRSRL